MKKALFAIITILAFSTFFSCNKDAQKIEQKFVEKPYHLFDQAEATVKVESFITALSPDWREDFDDTEINEAKWLLEATGNYMKNMNSNGVVREVDSLDVTIDLVNDGGVQKMTASSMTDKFNDVLDQVNTKESNDDVIATGMDVQIDEVTDDEVHLKFYVMYKKGAPLDYWTFPEAKPHIAAHLSATIEDFRNGCVQIWNPEIFIVSHGVLVCQAGNRETNYVLSSYWNPNLVYYYGEDVWAQEDAETLFYIAMADATDPANAVTLSSGETGTGAVYSVRFREHRTLVNPPNVPNSDAYMHRYYLQITYLSGISWCY